MKIRTAIEQNEKEIERLQNNVTILEKMNFMAADIVSEINGAMNDMAGGDEGEADELYNDKFVMSDLLGSKLFAYIPGTSREAYSHREVLASRVYDRAHKALQDACIMFLTNK